MRIAGNHDDRSTAEHGAQALDMLPPRLLCIALVIALVSTLVSLSAAAQEAVVSAEADATYASAEAAFAGVFLRSGLGERAYRENREYAAALYQLPDGRWRSTPVVAGGRTGSTIPYHAVPERAVRIVGAHTHGQPHIPEDPRQLYGVDFSQADLRNAVHNYRSTHGRIAAQLLLSSEFKILRLTLTGEPELAMGVAFVRSADEARLTPGAIHGTTEVLDQLAIPVIARNAEGADRAPYADQALGDAPLALGMLPSGRN